VWRGHTHHFARCGDTAGAQGFALQISAASSDASAATCGGAPVTTGGRVRSSSRSPMSYFCCDPPRGKTRHSSRREVAWRSEPLPSVPRTHTESPACTARIPPHAWPLSPEGADQTWAQSVLARASVPLARQRGFHEVRGTGEGVCAPLRVVPGKKRGLVRQVHARGSMSQRRHNPAAFGFTTHGHPQRSVLSRAPQERTSTEQRKYFGTRRPRQNRRVEKDLYGTPRSSGHPLLREPGTSRSTALRVCVLRPSDTKSVDDGLGRVKKTRGLSPGYRYRLPHV
jgi:hypothetical protein